MKLTASKCLDASRSYIHSTNTGHCRRHRKARPRELFPQSVISKGNRFANEIFKASCLQLSPSILMKITLDSVSHMSSVNVFHSYGIGRKC